MIAIIAFLAFVASVSAWPTRTGHHHFHSTITNGSRPTSTLSTGPWLPWPTATNGPGRGNDTAGNSTGVSWLPRGEKVRGVNLGSQFIIEPWMAYDEFNSMGCGDQNDEWSCVQTLGQDAADAVFATHWNTWTTQEDITNISSWGLNVIRIPVGFWMKEDLVNDDEFYPRGGLTYLDRLVGWAADAGLYVIMDLHGGPGSQYPNQQFTGHGVDEPGFYTPQNYGRAIEFLEWMAQRIHSNNNYRTTGVLQVMNEPVHASQYPNEAADMLENFYAPAYDRIRSMEKSLGVSPQNELRVQFMGDAWGAGDPTSFLPSNATDLLFDDHRYYKWDTTVTQNKDGYISAVCSDDRGGEDIIVGEWSISVADDSENTLEFGITGNSTEYVNAQKQWYQSFWAAQVETFEKSGGWVFWTYKCNWIGGKDEWRWCYQSAVAAGVIPEDVSSASNLSPC